MDCFVNTTSTGMAAVTNDIAEDNWR